MISHAAALIILFSSVAISLIIGHLIDKAGRELPAGKF